MTDATKKEALVKLHAVANKIGYPDTLARLRRADHRARRRARQLAAHATPSSSAASWPRSASRVDKSEWR